MKKLALVSTLFILVLLVGCGPKVEYTAADIDSAAEQLSVQQDLDSAIYSGVSKGDYEEMINDANKSLNAFKNSNSAHVLPEIIAADLSAHMLAHSDANRAWDEDLDKAQAEYDAAFDDYLDDVYADSPDIEDYTDKYDSVQDEWEALPSLDAVSSEIAACRDNLK